jgi:hypothetical protein
VEQEEVEWQCWEQEVEEAKCAWLKCKEQQLQEDEENEQRMQWRVKKW